MCNGSSLEVDGNCVCDEMFTDRGELITSVDRLCVKRREFLREMP